MALRWGDLAAGGVDPLAQILDQAHQEAVAVEGLIARDAVGGVQPAQLRLALGVDAVVELHGFALDGVLRQNAVKPGVESVAGLGGDPKDLGLRVGRLEGDDEAGAALVIQRVALVDDDDLGFLELLLVDVDHLLGEGASGVCEAQNAFGAGRVDEHA